jgi:hypothetical protein
MVKLRAAKDYAQLVDLESKKYFGLKKGNSSIYHIHKVRQQVGKESNQSKKI